MAKDSVTQFAPSKINQFPARERERERERDRERQRETETENVCHGK
jgi:hypothetical protein